jgi:hypothetical protein
MKRLQHTAQAQHSRRDARARVFWCEAATAPFDAVVVMLGTLVTTKINPRWLSGGLPREGVS